LSSVSDEEVKMQFHMAAEYAFIAAEQFADVFRHIEP